jgi:hypothetical protein
MAAVARLETLADVDDDAGDAGQMSVSVRHEAVLEDGRRLLLLDDRGWSSSLNTYRQDDVPDDGSWPDAALDAWAVQDIEQTARMVAGPDEPFDGRSQEDAETDHWAWLAALLGRQGVVADAEELKRLPHDVVLSERLLARARPAW